MAEKKRISGEKRTNSAGRVALTPTRSSPRNKINVANNSQVNDEIIMAKNKKLVQTKLNFIRTSRKQNTTEEAPPVEEVTLLETPKKRGRKPGTKKQENKPDDNSGQENGHDDVPNGRKRQKKNKINGADDNVLWIKSEFTMPMRASRGLAKRAGKEADCSTEEQGESPASPLLTYPGDLKCEACQRTFSNSSGFKRHLKFCLDAEGPPVVMKLKKPQAQVVSAAIVNGAIPKSVIDPEKKLATREKEGKGKTGRGRTDQSPQPERTTRNETEPSKKVTKKTPAREKRAEESSNADKKKDVAPEVGGKEAGKATRGRPPSKKSDEEQKKRVGRRSEGAKAAEGEEKKMDDGDVVKEKNTRGGRKVDAAKELARYTDQEDEDLDDSYIDERDDDDDDDDMNDVFDNSVSLSDIEDMEAEEGEPHLGIGAEKSLREKMKGVMLSKVNELIDETSATAPGKCHCCGEDLETAHLGGEFECDDCGKHFKLRASLDRHRRVIHLQGETHACPECDARCPDKGSLARHMYTHTGLKPYSCVRCKKQFSRKYHLERHIVQTGCDGNPKPTYPCQVCGRMFSRKDNLREHLRAHAGQVKRKKKYSCEYCLKEFHGTSLLRIHVRTHTGERPFVCDFCQKGFPSSGAMKKHRRMHTGERPYECKDCFAKFSAKETLNRHARTHTGLKPHVCNYCGKSFIQASQLRAHVFHHTGENGFTCDHCGKAFNRRARLHMHVKYVHEGARPFECSNCGKTFVRKEDLVRHTVLHSGVKAHKCPICEKSFAMKSSLKIHLLTHTKEPPRSCDECGRAFIRQDCLLRHMRSKHREMLEEILAEAEKKKLQQQLLAATATAAMASRMVVRGERARVNWGASRETHPDDDLEEEDDDMDDVPETGAIDRVLGMSGSESAKAGALLQHLTAMGEAAGANPIPRMDTAASAVLNSLGTSIPSGAHHHQSSNMVQGGGLSETALADSVKELLTLLVDDATLRAFGWPDAPVDKLLEAVIRRCGHQPASPEDYSRPSDRLRENAKLLFTVVIDDSAVKTLLNNQTVDEVILHVLRLAKS